MKEAASHLNENITITAKVYGTKDVSSMILVNVGAAYADSSLTVVLRGDAKALSAQIDNKTITVTGKIIDYKGKLEIVVTETIQIAIK